MVSSYYADPKFKISSLDENKIKELLLTKSTQEVASELKITHGELLGFLKRRKIPYKVPTNDEVFSKRLGEKFFKLTIVENISRDSVRCLCECGDYTTTLYCNLKSHSKKSCGCILRVKSARKKLIDEIPNASPAALA